MNDYKKLYYNLFNEISDTIESLVSVQRKAEESFLEFSDNEEATTISDSDVGESYGKIVKLLEEKSCLVVSNEDGVDFVIISKEAFEKLR